LTYKGEHISLRDIRPSDAKLLMRWENTHSENPEAWSGRYSLSDIEDYITQKRDVILDGQVRFMIDHLSSGESIGTVDLFDVNFDSGTTRIGILIANKADRGKGYAKEAVKNACHHALQVLGLTEVVAEVQEDNIPSQKLFTQCGFAMDDHSDSIMTYVLEKE